MHSVVGDLRYSLRTLARTPGPCAIAVFALALGIGANTTVFSFINAMLLRPLPYGNAARLVWIAERDPHGAPASVSAANLRDWSARASSFDQLAWFGTRTFDLQGADEPRQVYGGRVSPNFFQTLGAQAMLGRVFLPDDGAAGAPRVAVLNYGIWKRAFGGDPAVLGRTVASAGGETYSIIGVLGPEFWFVLPDFQIWVPAHFSEADLRDRAARRLAAVATLRPGVSLRRAQTEMDTVATRLARENPREDGGWGASVRPLNQEFARFVRPSLLLLVGAVVFVLLLACANAAGLLLARASSRRKEIAIRVALGAPRWRIARQLLADSLLLSLAGGLAGLLLAWWGARVLPALLPAQLPIPIPGRGRIGIDGPVLGFTLGVSILSALLFGLAPALGASRGVAGQLRGPRSRSILVIAEIAASLVLLVGAGLLLRSFAALERVDVGVRFENVLAMRVPLSPLRYPDRFQRISFYRRLLQRLETLPGVESAAFVNYLPLTGERARPVAMEGRGDIAETARANYLVISPNYFRVMGVSQHAGRDFDGGDTETSPPVTIVSEAMARRYWPGADPIGRRLRVTGGPWLTVVGVVGDVRYNLAREPGPALYRPFRQDPPGSVNFTLRTRIEAAAIAPAARAVLRALDRDQVTGEVDTLEEMFADQVWQQRLTAVLVGIFAAVALLLAGAGIYGALSQAVAQRTREIGVRVAVGARPEDVRRMIVRQALRLAGPGVVFGLIAALALTRLMKSLLYGVAPADPATLVAMPLLVAGVALAASYLPARRAAGIEPMAALRHE